MTARIPANLAPVLDLLQRSGLPTEDLADARAEDFRVIERAGEIMGCVAVETYGSHGLLRSLAVATEARGLGLGGRLVEAAEALARERKLATLVLLTTTAAPFFDRLGYARMDRAELPDALQQSSEVASVCPASAVAMGKTLSPPILRAPEVRPTR